jgi:hypothetical protein
MKVLFGVLQNRRNTAKRHRQARAATLRLLALHQGLAGRCRESDGVDSLLVWAEKEHADALVVLRPGLCITDNEAIVRATCEMIEERVLICADNVVVTGGARRAIHIGGFGFLAVNISLWQRAKRPGIVLQEAETCTSNKNPDFSILSVPLFLKRCCVYLSPTNATLFRDRERELRDIGKEWCNQPWFLNTEDPAAWHGVELNGPCQTLVSVAAGLIPNVILHVAGFNELTKVVFFDISENALRFRHWLIKEWDGIDYQQAVRDWLGENKHVHNWQKIDSGFAHSLSRAVTCFGGSAGFAKHWKRYRHLDHEFIQADVLRTDPSVIFKQVGPQSHKAIIWWSNVFHSLYTHTHCSPETVSSVYEAWVTALDRTAPDIVAFGQDDLGRPVARTIPRKRKNRP